MNKFTIIHYPSEKIVSWCAYCSREITINVADILWLKATHGFYEEKWTIDYNDKEDLWRDYLNEREIIFTPEFMDKFWKYCFKKAWWFEREQEIYQALNNFINHLDNPIEYLYNLIK